MESPHENQARPAERSDVQLGAARCCSRTATAWSGSLPDAEDAVQEALVRAWRHLGSFRGDAGLGLLRDVLGYSARETAEMLNITPTAAHSALQHARSSVTIRVTGTSQQRSLRALWRRRPAGHRRPVRPRAGERRRAAGPRAGRTRAVPVPADVLSAAARRGARSFGPGGGDDIASSVDRQAGPPADSDRPGRLLAQPADQPGHAHPGPGQPRRRRRPARGAGPVRACRRLLRPRLHDGKRSRRHRTDHPRDAGRLRHPPRRDATTGHPSGRDHRRRARLPDTADGLPDGHGRWDGRWDERWDERRRDDRVDRRTHLRPGPRRPDRRLRQHRDDQTVAFGSTEEWVVTNSSPLAHPFHLHVWPFTVVAASDGRATTGTPQDVVLVQPRGSVRLRIPFTTFSGRSVYHCHILDHEDAGMMATVSVT